MVEQERIDKFGIVSGIRRKKEGKQESRQGSKNRSKRDS